eukprot:gb/GEZN01036165.1/.p1 GENE.gb/GEZN01036165.1/~~gb/GEZN01036165.1/.p1  ORF type:complete len:113 (+),score=6.37 gb/GEZN01036165.1/:31-339(+)
MLGWAPATLRLDIQQYNVCGFYAYQSNGYLYSQAGQSCTLFAGSVPFQAGGICISTLDEGARTISFQLPGQTQPTIAFTNVPQGMQPAFCLCDQNTTVEFVE